VPAGVELRTDHGPHAVHGADCAALVEAWGLVHTFAPVGRPTGNAVAERVIRTMKEELVWLRDWNSADELREALLAWQHRYNSQRPHQALAGGRRPSTEPRSSASPSRRLREKRRPYRSTRPISAGGTVLTEGGHYTPPS